MAAFESDVQDLWKSVVMHCRANYGVRSTLADNIVSFSVDWEDFAEDIQIGMQQIAHERWLKLKWSMPVRKRARSNSDAEQNMHSNQWSRVNDLDTSQDAETSGENHDEED